MWNEMGMEWDVTPAMALFSWKMFAGLIFRHLLVRWAWTMKAGRPLSVRGSCHLSGERQQVHFSYRTRQ